MAEVETNELIIERMLMKFDDIPDRDKLKVNVFLIDIEGIGAWVVKFRKTGVIVNNRDLIISVNVDATISFKTVNSFFRVMDGASTINDELGKGKLCMTGATEALESFHSKWLRICDLPNTINAVAPTRPNRFVSVDGTAPALPFPTSIPHAATASSNNTKSGQLQPLKAGWLLKKRDIFSGWRCRYFVVFPDRLEYFVDQCDATPKATMSLVDVEVQPVKRVNMQGTGEHWGIIVTTKNPKSTFRLASELTGMEGMVECATWEKVFNVARNSCEQNLDSIVTDSEVAKFRRQEEVRSALAKAGAGVKSPAKHGTSSDSAEHKDGWFEYVTSKRGAPRVLLFVGLAVLLIRIAWNVTKLRVMLRTIVFHGLVAVVLVLILFFLKSVFSEYFAPEESAAVDTTASFSTIVPSRFSFGRGLKKGVAASKDSPAAAATAAAPTAPTATAAAAAAAGGGKGGTAGTTTAAVAAAGSSTAGLTLSGPSATSASGAPYGSISPLPPHVINTSNGTGTGRTLSAGRKGDGASVS